MRAHLREARPSFQELFKALDPLKVETFRQSISTSPLNAQSAKMRAQLDQWFKAAN